MIILMLSFLGFILVALIITGARRRIAVLEIVIVSEISNVALPMV